MPGVHVERASDVAFDSTSRAALSCAHLPGAQAPPSGSRQHRIRSPRFRPTTSGSSVQRHPQKQEPLVDVGALSALTSRGNVGDKVRRRLTTLAFNAAWADGDVRRLGTPGLRLPNPVVDQAGSLDPSVTPRRRTAPPAGSMSARVPSSARCEQRVEPNARCASRATSHQQSFHACTRPQARAEGL